MRRKFMLALVIATCAACALLPPASAQDKAKLHINAFNSASIWPLWAAQKIGAFAKQGLNIDLSYPHGSKPQMTGLIEGKYDIVSTALDNVIAYSEGEGAPGAPKNADLIAFLGGDNGSLVLAVQPTIKTVKDLKGKVLAVDAVSTGFSFVLREILARNGLKADDYTLKPFGASKARFVALQDGSAAGALLSPPYNVIAPASGFPAIAEASSVLGGYQGSVSAARRDWAKQHRDLVIRYIRAWRAGLGWLNDPKNEQAAIALLVSKFPQTTPPLARATYEKMVASGKAFDPGGKLDLAGAKTVFDLRRRYGPQGKGASDVSQFIDESYYDAAIKR